MDVAIVKSPFHRGEKEIQARMGVRDQVEELGRRFIRDHMPDEHREFYEQLPLLLVGSVDDAGRPWASVIVGRPGFIRTPDAYTLDIAARRIHGDPLSANTAPGTQVGVLGILYDRRRRNRMTATVVSATDERLILRVVQTFGNCPQYIQSREAVDLAGVDRAGDTTEVLPIAELSERAGDIVGRSDHFFIATYYCEDPDDPSHGADVSHRGGRPGFVRAEDERTLVFPDFAGNNHYNTIGNLQLNPVAGLLFVDFDDGDLLYLTCKAEIVWDSEALRAFEGAQRLVRFSIVDGLLVRQGLPLAWQFQDYSPSLDATGSWQEVDARIAAKRAENTLRAYRVLWTESESSVIRSYYLVPDDEGRIPCHKAGQFLPIEITPPAASEPVRRTYTISNAPNGEYYRLSIKREPAPSENTVPGIASNYFHDLVHPGSIIHAYAPRGQFGLVDDGVRPVVLISGGVGVTPMISMLEQLWQESTGCGCERPVWFIHGAISSREHAFADRVRHLGQDWPCLTTHVAYSNPSAIDVEGIDYDSKGYITVDLLRSLLPWDDYDFYFCGPPPFMQSIYDGLKDLNVPDDRINFEFFGPGTTLRKEESESTAPILNVDALRSVPVSFATSEIDTVWDPSRGTILELAEAEGLTPVYSCRSGICSTCQTRIQSGNVEYVEPPVAEPGEGNALICCAYPSPDNGHLVIDL